MNNKILVTGTKSGLGKYIYETLPNTVGLSRENRKILIKKNDCYDMIIHCAFNTKNAGKKDIDDYFDYVDDNILLTNDLVKLKHKKFVYMSSISVYDKIPTPYNQTKLFAESIVQKISNKPLIIRCASLLGSAMRSNTITKIITEDNPRITLSKESTYNFVMHKDIVEFISKCYNNNVTGIFDFLASDFIRLEDIVKRLNREVNFGEYTFTTNKVDNKKLTGMFPEFNKSSWEALELFIEEIK